MRRDWQTAGMDFNPLNFTITDQEKLLSAARSPGKLSGAFSGITLLTESRLDDRIKVEAQSDETFHRGTRDARMALCRLRCSLVSGVSL